MAIDPNIIDATNLSALIENVAGIFPGVTSLIGAIIGPMILIALVGFIGGIFASILGMLRI